MRFFPFVLPTMVSSLVLSLAACGEEAGTELIDGVFLPDAETATFVSSIDHPHFPVPAGASWIYEGATAERSERREVTVLPDPGTVKGITVVQVKEAVHVDLALIAETTRSYAQDDQGNVWLLAEAACSFEEEACLSTAGSWELGAAGARGGYAMPAAPAVDGQPYFHGYVPGVAEDAGEVIEVGAKVNIGDTAFEDCIKVRETSALTPGAADIGTWCAGTGLVHLVTADAELSLVESTGL